MTPERLENIDLTWIHAILILTYFGALLGKMSRIGISKMSFVSLVY